MLNICTCTSSVFRAILFARIEKCDCGAVVWTLGALPAVYDKCLPKAKGGKVSAGGAKWPMRDDSFLFVLSVCIRCGIRPIGRGTSEK